MVSWTDTLGMYQRAVCLGWPGEAYFKFMYSLLKLHPALFRWGLRFYAADLTALYSNPDLSDAIERTFPAFQHLNLNAILPYFKFMPQIDITPQLERIRAKTLVITDDCDPIVPPSQSDLIAKQVKGAELAVIHGAGHLPFTERPVEYNHCLSKWLKQTN